MSLVRNWDSTKCNTTMEYRYNSSKTRGEIIIVKEFGQQCKKCNRMTLKQQKRPFPKSLKGSRNLFTINNHPQMTNRWGKSLTTLRFFLSNLINQSHNFVSTSKLNRYFIEICTRSTFGRKRCFILKAGLVFSDNLWRTYLESTEKECKISYAKKHQLLQSL